MRKLEAIIVNRQGEQRSPSLAFHFFVSPRLTLHCSDELGGEVFELLTSLGEFSEFKDLMIAYKQSKAAPTSSGPTGFGLDFAISGKKV